MTNHDDFYAILEASNTLPLTKRAPGNHPLEIYGVIVGEPLWENAQFTRATWPEGWSKRKTGTGKAEIIDHRGAVRASIFHGTFVGSFYAALSDCARFTVEHNYGENTAKVVDAWGGTLYTSPRYMTPAEAYNDASTWIRSRRPGYSYPGTYWDDASTISES